MAALSPAAEPFLCYLYGIIADFASIMYIVLQYGIMVATQIIIHQGEQLYMTEEKKLIGFHMVVLIVCGICRIFCQMNMQEWYYRYQYSELYMVGLMLARPLFYYAAGFLAVYLSAKNMFRNDLQLPYRELGITASIFLVAYALLLLIVTNILLDTAMLGKVHYFAMIAFLDYYWLFCIPGILLGLAAEKRWRNALI